MQLLIATTNEHKFKEIKALLPSWIIPYSLKDVAVSTYHEEPHEDLIHNAEHKARFYFEQTQVPTLADDTGLFVEALNGAPGVHSARFAGEPPNDEANRKKLLQLLQNETNRNAYFLTALCFYLQWNEIHIFLGKLQGTITYEERGTFGFGYDPIFQPLNSNKTLAELPMQEKNRISHRFQAIQSFVAFLKRYESSLFRRG